MKLKLNTIEFVKPFKAVHGKRRLCKVIQGKRLCYLPR